MNITYTKVGDYYLPNLKFLKQINNSEIGKYGRVRLKYLKEHLICVNMDKIIKQF